MTVKRVLAPSFAGLLVLLLVIASISPIQSRDVFWHLKTGEYVLETRSIPDMDPFSFTMQGKPWRAHEWLSDLAFHLIVESCAGISGLLVLKCLCISLTFLMVYFMGCEVASSPMAAFLLVILAGLVCLPSFLVRPQLFTYVLFAFTYYSLRSFPRRRWLYGYPLLAFIWSHLHGAFIFGHALFGLFIADSLFSYLRARWSSDGGPHGEDERIAWGRLWRLTAIGVCSVLTPLAGPGFIKVYTYPLEYLGQTLHKTYIYEWFPPDFNEELPTELFLFLLAGMLVGLPRNRFVHAALLLIPFTHLALTSARHIPLWVIVAVPLMLECRFLKRAEGQGEAGTPRAGLLESMNGFCQRMSALNRQGSMFLPLVVSVVIAGLLLLNPPFPDNPRGEEWIPPAKFPVAAVTFLQTRTGSPRLFNDYDWGGYIMWRTDWPVYIDGRADLYIPEHFLEYFATISPRDDRYRRVLEAWKIDTILVNSNAVLAHIARDCLGWRELYRDDIAVVLASP